MPPSPPSPFIITDGPIPRFSHSPENKWIFTEKQTLYETPTVLRGDAKWDIEAEVWSRHQSCIFIEKICRSGHIVINPDLTISGLAMPSEVVNTAKVLFHRMLMKVAIQSVYRWELCATIVFLCGKLGDSKWFRRLEAVAYTCAAVMKKSAPSEIDCKLWKQRIQRLESFVLKETHTDLVMPLPHPVAEEIISSFKGSDTLHASARKCCDEA
ncbi:hypothetical protein HKX48_002513 [Thoreauomyces humboldtii]|nr:hypothetical protein HKX48_002513 [Thoreauomyces humboldtii]